MPDAVNAFAIVLKPLRGKVRRPRAGAGAR